MCSPTPVSFPQNHALFEAECQSQYRLPGELLANIITLVRANDRTPDKPQYMPGMYACSLVCHEFYNFCLPHIFERVVIHDSHHRIHAFKDLISRRPAILTVMQDVVITPPNGSTIFVEAACLITSTMYSMPKLRMISLESVRITGDQVTKELCRNLASFAPNPVGLHFNECEVSANIVVAIACALPNVTGLYLDNTSYPQRLPDLTDSDTQTLLPDSLNQSENDDSHTEARRATHPLHIHDDAVEMRRRYSSKLNLTVFKMRFIIHPEAYLEKIVQFSTSLDKISYAAFTVDLDDASHSLEPISKFIGRLGLGLNYLDVRLRRLSPWYFSGHWHSDLRSTGMKVTYPPSTCRKPRELLVYPELDAREIELVNQIAGMQFNGIQFNMWPPDVYHNSTWTLWCVEDDPDIPSDIPAAEYCMSYGLSGTLSLEEGPTFDTKCDGHFWRRTNENVSQLYGYAGRLRGNVKN